MSYKFRLPTHQIGAFHRFRRKARCITNWRIRCQTRSRPIIINQTLIAFTGSTSAVIFEAILNKAPTSPVRLNPKLPDELDRIINKALELDEMLPEAHAMKTILRAYEFDWKGAEREFRRALELNPKSEDVWEFYDYSYLVPMRRLDEAVAASQRALELDPLRPFLQWRLGYRYYLTRQWNRAIEQFHNALDLDPQYVGAHFYLGLVYSKAGRFDEAMRAFEPLAPFAGAFQIVLGPMGFVYTQAGRIGEAQKLFKELPDRAQKTHVSPFSFVWMYFSLGEVDRSFDWFDKAVDEREGLIIHLHLDPLCDPLRSYPRYQALLRKMNLEP